MATAGQERFDWALVRSFLAVLDAGSLMGAARKLHAHQPTLSRHVAELEAQLGAPLFERTGRGVTPTATALAIADAARQMAAGADALVAHGHRRGAASPAAACASRPAWSRRPGCCRRCSPRCSASSPTSRSSWSRRTQLTNLLRREADIAVRMVRPAQASLVARKLGEIGIGAVAHESYLATRRHAARAGRPRRAHARSASTRDDSILRGFARLGLPLAREHFALRTDDQVAYGSLVAEGAGIGFVAHYVARQWPGVARCCRMLADPAAAVLARGAPRDPLEPRRAAGLRLPRACIPPMLD